MNNETYAVSDNVSYLQGYLMAGLWILGEESCSISNGWCGEKIATNSTQINIILICIEISRCKR